VATAAASKQKKVVSPIATNKVIASHPRLFVQSYDVYSCGSGKIAETMVDLEPAAHTGLLTNESSLFYPPLVYSCGSGKIAESMVDLEPAAHIVFL